MGGSISNEVKKLTNQIDVLQSTMSNYETKLNEERNNRRISDLKLDEAEMKVRKLDASYDILKNECDTLHEKLALKDLDIDELRLELIEVHERHRQEVQELKDDLIALRNK